MKKLYTLFVLIFAIFIAGCGKTETNLGMTADEFISAYNTELENLSSQSKNQLDDFKITNADETSGQFNLENVSPDNVMLKFEIDENSSEKYLKLVTFEIFEEAYYGKDAKENIENAEIAKNAFASAATQKRSTAEKMEEVVNSTKGEQEGNILKDDGIVFAWLKYEPGGKYLIAAENYEEQNQEIIAAKQNKELTQEVAEKNEQLKLKEEQERKAKAEQEKQQQVVNDNTADKSTEPIMVSSSFVPSNSEIKNHSRAFLAEHKCVWCGKKINVFAYDNYPMPPKELREQECPKGSESYKWHNFVLYHFKQWMTELAGHENEWYLVEDKYT